MKYDYILVNLNTYNRKYNQLLGVQRTHALNLVECMCGVG